ncbi:MAG: hypothetical protein ACRD3N_13205 [Terracidiphilus sp.]
MEGSNQSGRQGSDRKACIMIVSLAMVAAMGLMATPSAKAQVTGTVNFTSQLQQIDGFGVAATFGRPSYIETMTGSLPGTTGSLSSETIDMLFNPVDGAGVSMLRMGVDDVTTPLTSATDVTSPSGFANSGIFIAGTTAGNTPSSCSETPNYTFDNSAGGEIWMGQQAVKYGVKGFYANSWGAPSYMKNNDKYYSGGVVCDGTSSTSSTQCNLAGNGASCMTAYANYMVQFVQDYLANGVPISAMDWINEPDANTGSYASMTPTSAEAITFLDTYGPIVRAALPGVKQVCCDVYNWNTANTYNTAIVNDATANSYVDIYSAHEYGQVANFVLTTAPAGSPIKKNWMTEWGPQSPDAWNPYWDTVFAGTSNNYNDGMFIANDISNALNLGQISAYLYWYSDSTSSTGAMLEPDGPYAPGKTYTAPASTLTVPARFYALAHFSRFVHPGAYQVTMTTNSPACTTITQGKGGCIVPTAFINPDGSKVINVVDNYTTGSQTLTLTLDASTAGWLPAAYVTDVNTIPNATANSDSPEAVNAAVALTSGVATLSATTLTATLPARSFTTIVLTPPVVSGTVQLVMAVTQFAEGDGTYQSTVHVSNTGTGTAQNVVLTGAKLGSAAGSTLPTAALPLTVGNIAPGTSTSFVVNFPSTAGTPGAATVEKLTGTYTGGTWGGSIRTVLPSLP